MIEPLFVEAVQVRLPVLRLRPGLAELLAQLQVPVAQGETRTRHVVPPSQNIGIVAVPPPGRVNVTMAERLV